MSLRYNDKLYRDIDELKADMNKPQFKQEPEMSAKESKQYESVLQEYAESWLRSKHYMSRTPKHLMKPDPYLAGWFLHWHGNLESQPIVLDLLIIPFPNNRPVLEVELKSVARFRPGQKKIIGMGGKLCYDMLEFQRVVEEWEAT